MNKRTEKRLTAYILGEMKERELTQSDMGELLGISHQAFSQKMKNRRFDLQDLSIIFQKFNPSPEELHHIFCEV